MSNQSTKYSILFVGDLTPFSRSSQRRDALLRLGTEVEGVSWSSDAPPRFLEKVFSKLRIPLDRVDTNNRIRALVQAKKFDVIWVEKGNIIWPKTLRFVKKVLPGAKLISLSEDDMYARHNQSYFYRWGLGSYDWVFTTKKYNLSELKQIGAKQTELFLDAYDETLHRPVVLNERERILYGCDVGFIGTFEEDRAQSMLFLAENGIKVSIWGNGWGTWKKKHTNLIVKDSAIYGREYVKAICATKINLCFLRKINRDEVTSRSVEIPACGAFMLGERTERHKEFFNERSEAEFFGSDRELLDKARYYLEHEEERGRIALAGKKRCESSGYGMEKQLQEVLLKIFS